MERVIEAWHYLLAEPCTWIFYCFFQPRRFQREIDPEQFSQRLRMILRLVVPMVLLIILVAFPLASAGRLVYLMLGLVHDPSPVDFFRSIVVGIVVGIAFGIGGGIAFGIGVGIGRGIVGGIGEGIVVGIGVGIGVGIVAGIAFGIVGGIGLDIVVGIVVGIAFGIVGGIGLDIVRGIVGGILVGIVGGILVGIVGGIVGGIAGGIAGGMVGGISLIIGYMLGYFRLPLYLISGPSGLKNYVASHNNPQQVFTNLHHSSLYWDEKVYLPLPFLKHTLLIAVDEDIEKTLEEIAFIVAERPQQMRAAREAVSEIVVRHLETCNSLTKIAEATERLAEILPSESKLVDPRWVTPLARLRDAIQDATRYCSPVGRQARHQALEDMKSHLHRVHPASVFRNQKLNHRLGLVIETWLALAEQEQDKLKYVSQELGRIDNPYRPGILMKAGDTQFVGRRDLAQRLEEALSRKEGRPAFLLYGERRMGKTTTLIQLPVLLGSHHLPLFFDLQEPGLTSNAAAFLRKIAAEMFKALQVRGFKISQLSYEVLKEAQGQNEAAVYDEFNRWLEKVERLLEQENRTLLLSFDEFEKLNEVKQAGYLDLNLLLNWFRHLIQHHLRLALLFSGTSTFEEMEHISDVNWAGYFVNVLMLHVGFLSNEDARHLIIEPIPNFTSRTIFSDEIVEKIIEQTHSHPFLIQALCSALIERLNAAKREQVESSDVDVAIEQVLDGWWDNYFRELWRRTNEQQRLCLEILQSKEQIEVFVIMRQSGLDERTVRSTMRILARRDLVIDHRDGSYSIAAPIFRKWVERSLQG
jgi:predicted transcriptional regulator